MTKHPTDLKQVSALLKALLPVNDAIADYGAGTGIKSAELAASLGKTLYRYDPALPAETNLQFWAGLPNADLLTCANVLNVITDDAELYATIDKVIAAASLTRQRTAIFSVYKAPKPSKTQRAEGLDQYRAHLITRAPSGSIITVRGWLITLKLP